MLSSSFKLFPWQQWLLSQETILFLFLTYLIDRYTIGQLTSDLVISSLSFHILCPSAESDLVSFFLHYWQVFVVLIIGFVNNDLSVWACGYMDVSVTIICIFTHLCEGIISNLDLFFERYLFEIPLWHSVYS